MSNTLVPQNNNTGVDVKRISSREVAEMMEVTHKNLLRKIGDINKVFGSSKLSHEKYWIEGTFENRGKQYKEYLVSKEGCEFLAHKSTGEKGILFTHRYMERFKEMEQQIEQQVLSVEQITQIATVAAQAAAQAAIAPIMDRLEKLIAPKEAPKTKEIKIKTPYSVTKISKLANMSRNDVNPILRDQKIISGNTRTGWVLNKEYEEAGWGITNENGGQYNGSFVTYSEKGKDAILKILSRVNGQEQLKLY